VTEVPVVPIFDRWVVWERDQGWEGHIWLGSRIIYNISWKS
jgi:hypothetical protein